MKWRPENWTYGDGYSKPQRKCLHGKGRVRAFEAGADAMLEALRADEGAVNYKNVTVVSIPDDPQPYVPEKWVDVTYEHLREKLGKYKYGLR